MCERHAHVRAAGAHVLLTNRTYNTCYSLRLSFAKTSAAVFAATGTELAQNDTV